MMSMQEHEYKARDKTVQKMGRDGLREQNLHSKEVRRITNREEDKKYSKEKVKEVDLGKIRSPTEDKNLSEEQPSEHKKRKNLYAKNQTDQAEPEDSVETEQGEVKDLPPSVQRAKSVRTQTKGHMAYLDSVTVTRSERKKKMVEAYAKKERKKESAKESVRPEKSEKADLPDRSRPLRKASSVAAGTGIALLHEKVAEDAEENSAVEGAHQAERTGERLVRASVYAKKHRLNHHSKRSRRLRTGTYDEAEKSRLILESAVEGEKTKRIVREAEQVKKNTLKKMLQKKRYQKQYQAAKQGKKAQDAVIVLAQNFTGKAKDAVKMLAVKRNQLFTGIGAVFLIFMLLATTLSSCGAMFEGVSTSIISTSYSADDADIYAAENAYKALETALNHQINQMETAHPEYDEYNYQIDEISHNPYHLISYLTVKYGGFTYAQVADEIEEIFRAQYTLYTESVQETVTETKSVKVGESLGQVVTSGYCNCSICCGVWSGGPTASGAYPTSNHTIAVDASNPFVPMGTHIVMNGVEYVVEDTGNFAQYGVQFDVYYGDHSAASAHGHQTWEAYIADSNGSQEVEVTTTQEVNRLNATLTNQGLDAVLRSRMTAKEQEQYDLYNTYYGNRSYLFDVNNLPYTGTGTDGFGYDIPAEALTNQKFANMIQEAEKYLGYPYVWGGASPSTSFDCSGFVCWVINNCGNGWNVGRLTADGLRSVCSYVSPSEAKPGDLIFFEKTYNTTGASHVGIYVGNGMMIHCGNPIKYTSIETSYWQEHFLAFGRIH
jgi:cell wall-associated NlpC family hydrolase